MVVEEAAGALPYFRRHLIWYVWNTAGCMPHSGIAVVAVHEDLSRVLTGAGPELPDHPADSQVHHQPSAPAQADDRGCDPPCPP